MASGSSTRRRCSVVRPSTTRVGTTLASVNDEEALVVADVDPDRVDEVRREFPALADRR